MKSFKHSLKHICLCLFLVLPNITFAHVLPAQQEIVVQNEHELSKALKIANNQGHTKIMLRDGKYQLNNTINIISPYVTLTSLSADPNKVQIIGTGMRATKRVNNILRVAAPHFVLDGLTLQESGNHLIQIAGEQNADFPTLKNCILKDAYEQMVKVSYNRNTGIASDFGTIENCLFEYTKGIGPQYYIGGIDVHGGQDWLVQNNTFIAIASPEKKIAEHAIHFWNNTQNITVKGNTIINCDRGIGFGMPNRPNYGGLISDNLIIHANNNHPNADTGIGLEESQGTVVKGNRIFLAQAYPNAIEYRFKQTTNVTIIDNQVNKFITSRNGGSASLKSNKVVTDLSEMLSYQELKKWQNYLR
ncbi:right-handed parallel beta-helix repeat-containing protein [Paraglaciecola sp. L3A3]|uniref:right-handed parallel beta-helix repeat-containing protein n=1 Tax=Paraglaciecola sp. L3A3 TaxID=2686358 RepID=UPI00131C532E|nr:right-handed parallel beta-helix repeat-containing protein [Paraglaciecola sp. L3A3]